MPLVRRERPIICIWLIDAIVCRRASAVRSDPAMVSSIRSTARYLSRSTAASYRCSCCKKRIDVDRQNPSRFTTAFESRFFAAKLSQGRILGDFWRDRRQFSGQAWRQFHLLLYQRQKNAAHGAPSDSGTQQKLPKRSDKARRPCACSFSAA